MTVNEGDQTGSAMETSRTVRETRLCQGAEGGKGGTFTHGRLRGCRVLGGVLSGGTHQEVLPRTGTEAFKAGREMVFIAAEGKAFHMQHAW